MNINIGGSMYLRRFALAIFLTLGVLSAYGQKIEVIKSHDNGGFGIVHISIRTTFSNGIVYTQGYYHDDNIRDDSVRANQTVLSSKNVTDQQAYDVFNDMTNTGGSNYNAITHNCGDAIDDALDYANVDMGNTFSYSTQAIGATLMNVIPQTIMTVASSIWNWVTNFFGE